jgi:S1-C subfamily serine protease
MTDREVSRRRVVAAIAGAASGALAGCSLGGPQRETADTSTPPPDQTATVEPLGTVRDADEVVADSSYTELYRTARDSVAAVRVSSFGGSSQGTAWVYDGDYMVTNEHVVGEGSISVRFADEGWRDVSVVGTDVYSDLAVLRVADKPEQATALPLVDSPPPVGTHVAAIGNPFGLSGSLSAGIISGRGRTLPAPNNFSIPDAVQTDAALNPGNSGGPLVTLDGAVAGVVNSGGGDNIGFAISAALAKRVVPALVRDGEYEHSYMGVGIEPVTPRLVRANDLPVSKGVYVDQAVAGGPADGVLQGSTGSTFVQGESASVGGDVVLRLDDTPIPNREALSRFLALQASPGEKIEVGIYRDTRRTTVDLTLGARPSP